jgi:hypothetical protein
MTLSPSFVPPQNNTVGRIRAVISRYSTHTCDKELTVPLKWAVFLQAVPCGLKPTHFFTPPFGLETSFLQLSLLLKKKKTSVVLVRKRTIPTGRPQPAGEVSANFS